MKIPTGIIMRMSAFFAATLLLAACGDQRSSIASPGKASAVDSLAACPGFAQSGKPPLVYGAQCGELRVKENPDDANSADISLHILRLPAISPVAKPDPLFLIQGGPGGSSVDMAAQLHLFFSDVRKNRDLVFVDQRGTGKSNPLNCERLGDADLLLPEVTQQENYLALIKHCADKYRQQVPFYTTPYAVRDLDAVRRALGYEKINLWGGSYGTRVALEYMRQYPQHARTSVLDGVAPVQIALPLYFQRDAMAALQAVNRECQQQPKCQQVFGDIVIKAEQVHQRLLHAQEQGDAVRVNFEHPRNQQKTEWTLTPKNFAMLIFASLYSRDLTVLLPIAIANAERQDYRLLAVLYTLSAEQSSFTGISEGMRYSIVCNEDAHFMTPEKIASSHAFFGLNMAQDFADICALWPKAQLPGNYWLPIKSAVPALLLSGAHDPVTPAAWADFAAQSLADPTHLMAAGGNHIISTDGCVPKIITQFIERGTMAGIDTGCVATIKNLPFLLGANEKKVVSSSAVSSVAGTQP